MTERRQNQGDNYNSVQCPEISSSSDLNSRRFPQICPRARPTFRNPNNPFHNHRNSPPNMEMLNQSHFQNYGFGNNKLSSRHSLIYLAAMFTSGLFILYTIYSGFPALTEEEKVHIKIPWNLDDAKQLGIVLDKYKENHYTQVLLGVCITYIFLQTFAIPGSLFLSVLSGFLFPFFVALLLVCSCSAIGASLCFLISQLVGRKLIRKYFPERAESWAVTVNKHKENLLNYVIFLRVTPFLPNWFINLTAPVIGVPLVPFTLGTFIGVAPPSFIALQAGQTLHNMSASDSALSWTSVVLLILFGVFSLIPIYFKDKLKQKFD